MESEEYKSKSEMKRIEIMKQAECKDCDCDKDNK